MKLTVPFTPCVTLVSVGAPSKLSALAPPVPVITFAVTAVSSFVLKVSATMSATAVTVMFTTSVSVSVPPVPVAPRSLVVIVSAAAPLKSAVGA